MKPLLKWIGRKPIVVVTDRYPPSARGGAEVSLHIALRASSFRDDVLVIAFGDKNLVSSTYKHEGIRVLLLPRQAKWPLHRLPNVVGMGLEKLPSRHRRALIGGLQRAAGLTQKNGSAADQAAAWTAFRDKRPRGGPVCDFLEYPSGLMASRLTEVLRYCRPELVHADNYRGILAVAVATRDMDVKRVGVVRDNRFHCVRHDQSVHVEGVKCTSCNYACAEIDLPTDPGLQRLMLEKSARFRHEALRTMDRIIVTSRYLEEEISKISGPDKLVRIPNTPDDYEQCAEHMRGVAELPGTNVLMVGMLNQNKGQHLLAERLDDLVARIPDVVLHLAGRGARFESSMRRLAAEKGLSDRLVFHGYVGRERLYELYAQCQIVALPTVWPEPFGRVPLEAAVARRPVISFAVGGLAESILDETTGLLVAPGDVDAFIEALGRLADDPARQRELGLAAKKHILSNYATEEMRTRLAQTWGELRNSSPE